MRSANSFRDLLHPAGMCRIMISLIISIAFVQGLNSAALESKLINGFRLPNKLKIYLATMRYEKDGHWIRFCSLHCISPGFFLTVGQCISRMELHGGKDRVLIFLGNPTDTEHEHFRIKIYKDHADYLSRRRIPRFGNAIMTCYDLTLLWCSKLQPKAKRNVGLTISDEYISSLADSNLIGWSEEGDDRRHDIPSRIMVEDLDFERCTTLFKDRNINNSTHMCGHAVGNTQNVDMNDYGSPLLNEKNELIGIVSHVPILGLRFILFIRLNELALHIQAWKYQLNISLRKEASE